jgi:hypothetical protein
MRFRHLCLLFPLFLASGVHADPIVFLGNASSFAVLGGQTVTNTGPTVVTGNLGVSPGSAITGLPPGLVIGAMHAADEVALNAQASLVTAYNMAAGLPCTGNLTGMDLGGLTLTPGVYCFSAEAQLTGTLTLNALGNPNSNFVFQIGSTLTTASSSSVVFINGGDSFGSNTFWQVGSSATLGTGTLFTGSILALTDIHLNTGADIRCGRALARNGEVTMDTNDVFINTPGCETGGTEPIPEPSTLLLLATGVIGTASRLLRRRKLIT